MSQRIRALQELGREFERLAASSPDAAAGARGAWTPGRRLGGRLRAGFGVAPVLAAALVPLVVAAAALLLLGRGGTGTPASPPPGGGVAALIAHTPQRQLRREVAYIEAAMTSVSNRKACHLRPAPQGVTYVSGTPGAALLSVLGLLRRPATPTDRLPGLQSLLVGTPNIYGDDVRRAFSFAGTSYYIVPTRNDAAMTAPSDRCFGLQAAAVDRELAKVPVSLRQPTRELATAMLAYVRGLVRHAPRDGICLVTVGSSENGAACGTTASQISGGEASSPQDNNGTYIGIVPDGVATVTLAFPRSAGQSPRSVTGPVQGNVYAVALTHGPPPDSRTTPTVIWRNPQGRVLKRIAPPSAADRAAACKQQPIACLLISSATVNETSRSSGSATAIRAQPAPGSSR